MPTSNPDNEEGEFFGQFLNEYYAECDEHLTLVRRNLLALEAQVGRPQVDHALLDELFRSFHTLKGISAMVGLSAAEQLAHHLESYLRALRQQEAALDTRGLETLLTATSLLEQVIGARRDEKPSPDIGVVVEQLEALTLSGSPEPAPESSRADAPPHAAPANGAAAKRTWRVEFTPTPALAERGVNVNSVRARLQGLGEIVRATPQVRKQGEIAFLFVVATDAAESAFGGWEADGLTVAPFEEEAPAAVATAAPAPAVTLGAANVVRVDLARLDELMRMVGELVVSRARLEDQLKGLKRGGVPAATWRPLQETSHTIGRQLRDLRDGVMRVRMVQIGETFERMQFVVRDLTREGGKRVTLKTEGRETEIDKFLVERMTDPLMHLVRNAVTHGLETPAEREARGKFAEGRIKLCAATRGERVFVEVEDDGRGIDRARVAARAAARGLVEPGASLSDAALLDVLCAPGFSTRDEADRGSGRGVGMDVVRNTVEELGGSLLLETKRGRGTRFVVELPLTLALTEALIVGAGGQRFAVPQSAVREVFEAEPGAVKRFENNEVVAHRGGALPLVRLARLFNLEGEGQGAARVFVLGGGGGAGALGVVVDRVIGQREIVVRRIADPLARAAGVAGATELGDGRVVLILDVAALRQLAAGRL
ncbi:MAG: chemotaxis protein CheA [Acidobacteria bacterium]|nr:chemotaxis protein CheA [Acidobacteriota bacterium]